MKHVFMKGGGEQDITKAGIDSIWNIPQKTEKTGKTTTFSLSSSSVPLPPNSDLKIFQIF